MLSKTAWARAAVLTSAFALATTPLLAEVAFAQQTPSPTLEQARSGEDGSTGAGASPGSMESGAKRDKNGNGGNASAGGAGEVSTADGSSGSGKSNGNEAPLPENAALLDALGVLDDAEIYGLDILNGMDIPVELLPPPPAETAPAATNDINTGGQGSNGSNISTEPGSGSAPAGGSTTTSAADGAGSMTNGEKTRDRPRKKDAEGTTSADGGTNTNGGTVTDTSGSGGTTTGS